MKAAVVTRPGASSTAPLVSHRLSLEGLAEFLTRDRRAVHEDSIRVLIDPGM